MVGPAGTVAGRSGAITSAADSFQIRLFGRGAHGSMPQTSIDPVVMAAATVLRLQTIVAREVAPTEAAVVTIGALQAGTKENVIPDEAIIKLNVRTFDEGVRKRVLAAIERIVNAEAAASGAPKPPEITPLDRYALVVNDADASRRVAASFRAHFSPPRVRETEPTSASEDFGSFGAEWHAPSVFWFVGGTDPEVYAKAKAAGKVNEIPSNHNPRFAPVLHPTLRTGVEALVVAARPWLIAAKDADSARPR
jgi:hippurate hydrolase